MTALTKADIAEYITEHLGLNKRESSDLVENFFGQIAEALIAGDEVKISGLGNFVVRDKKERPGVNPKTGERVSIEARRVVTFKSGQKLRQEIDALSSTNKE